MIAASGESKMAWGVRVPTQELADLFAPQTVASFQPPKSGIDNLGITTVDTFEIPGKGKFTVDFKGFVRVVRSRPSSSEWNQAKVNTNLIEMRVVGESPEIGPIIVTLNPDRLSTGQLWTPLEVVDCDKPAKECSMYVSALFNLPRLGLTLFNQVPVQLTIENVQAIPPAGNPGTGVIWGRLPLYDCANPNGEEVAYITSLKFVMGTYITESELEALR